MLQVMRGGREREDKKEREREKERYLWVWHWVCRWLSQLFEYVDGAGESSEIVPSLSVKEAGVS